MKNCKSSAIFVEASSCMELRNKDVKKNNKNIRDYWKCDVGKGKKQNALTGS